MNLLYDKLDESFKASGVSLRYLAEIAGVAPSTAKRVLDRKNVQWSSFYRVSRALGYTPVIVDEDGNPISGESDG